MKRPTFSFTSESVSEGHPDKVADAISDALLDAHLIRDPRAHVAIETLCKDDLVVVGGEVASNNRLTADEVEAVIRKTIGDIGYDDRTERFNGDDVRILNSIGGQSRAIEASVNNRSDQGAGDQGILFGFASMETPELMPLPIQLAHRVTRTLAAARKSGKVPWLRPDAKAQVTVRYEDERPVEVTDLVVSTQHRDGVDLEILKDWVRQTLLPECLGPWNQPGIRLLVNPAGPFTVGGPEADCGLTGRKIIADTYGGRARHGGGAFSGKDASKVDRSAAYFARFVARQIVLRRLANQVEVQVAYAIGQARPVSVQVQTFGTGDEARAARFASQFDFRPAAIIDRLSLRMPLYASTTQYGHFGKPLLPWEK